MKILRVGTLVAALLLVSAPVCHAGPIDGPAHGMDRGSLTMLPTGALSWDGEGTASRADRWEVRGPSAKDLLLSLALPGLGELSDALESLADFLRIDDDLLHVAAEASPPLAKSQLNRDEVKAWVAGLETEEATQAGQRNRRIGGHHTNSSRQRGTLIKRYD